MPTSIGITLSLSGYPSSQQTMIGHTTQLPSSTMHTIATARTIVVGKLVAPLVSSDSNRLACHFHQSAAIVASSATAGTFAFVGSAHLSFAPFD